jgi:predicted DNA-binding protein YlxM (UPF0122 family)
LGEFTKLPERSSATMQAYATGCYSMKDIAQAFGVNCCAVIRAVRSAEKKQAQAGQDAEVATMPAIVATSAS